MVIGGVTATATTTAASSAASSAAVAAANAVRDSQFSSQPQWAQWVYFGLLVLVVILLCWVIFDFCRFTWEWGIHPWLRNKRDAKRLTPRRF